MAQTATRKKSSSKASGKAKASTNGKPKAKQNGKQKASTNGKPKAKQNGKNGGSVKKAAGGAAAKSALTTRPGGNVRLKMVGAALKAAAKKVGDRAQQTLPGALDKVRGAGLEDLRTLPIQCSLDVAVPLEAVWDEWMRFEWVPDGGHPVRDVERDDDRLFGELPSGEWEAEIVDEREDESFAWQTVEGSDVAGLLTFHRLSDRLTRLELQLDVIPTGMGEALSLVLHQADRRAEKVLRGFKAQVEALDPDEYPPLADVDDEDVDDEDADDEDADEDDTEADDE